MKLLLHNSAQENGTDKKKSFVRARRTSLFLLLFLLDIARGKKVPLKLARTPFRNVGRRKERVRFHVACLRACVCVQ